MDQELSVISVPVDAAAPAVAHSPASFAIRCMAAPISYESSRGCVWVKFEFRIRGCGTTVVACLLCTCVWRVGGSGVHARGALSSLITCADRFFRADRAL